MYILRTYHLQKYPKNWYGYIIQLPIQSILNIFQSPPYDIYE